MGQGATCSRAGAACSPFGSPCSQVGLPSCGPAVGCRICICNDGTAVQSGANGGVEADLPALLFGHRDSPPGVAKLPEFLLGATSPLRTSEYRTAGEPLLLGSPVWPEEVVTMDCPEEDDGGANPLAGRMVSPLLPPPPPPTTTGYGHEGCEVTLEALEEAVAAQAVFDFDRKRTQVAQPTKAETRVATESVPKLGLDGIRAGQLSDAEQRTASKAAPPLAVDQIDTDRRSHIHTERREDPQRSILSKASSLPVNEPVGDQAVCEPADEDVFDKAAEEAATRKERVREQWQSQERVKTFLCKQGFAGVCAPRRRLMGVSYPLHCAVKLRDADMVELLLQFKADPQQENSAGLTPQQYALDLNRRGSHADVMVALSRRAQLARWASHSSA